MRVAHTLNVFDRGQSIHSMCVVEQDREAVALEQLPAGFLGALAAQDVDITQA